MGLDSKFNKAADVTENLSLDLDISKYAYSKAKWEHKNKKEEDPTVVEKAKTAFNNAQKAWDDAKQKTDVIGHRPMKPFFQKKTY